MLAEKDASVGKAISKVWRLTEEELIMERCRAREDWIVNDRWKMNKIAQQEKELKEKDKQIKEKDEQIKEKDDKLRRTEDEIESIRRKLAEFES